ncbi:MAG TPA: PxKF domain-containing protein [Nitriliruptorales bacterium]|nr:PxKF domain-containing protein [Nitriliruptorales bacterium]
MFNTWTAGRRAVARRTNRRRTGTATLVAGALLLTTAGIALADNVQNDVETSHPSGVTLVAGDSASKATVGFRVHNTNGDGENGCNIDPGETFTLAINTPAGVAASPSSLSFNECNVWQSAEFSASSGTGGEVSLSITANSTGFGTYNLNSAKFNITVTPPANTDTTPPTLTVPANISQVAGSATGNTVNFSVSANDNATVPTIECSIGGTTLTPASTTLGANARTTNYSELILGTKVVSCQATDQAGNKSDSNASLAGAQPHTFTIAVLFDFVGFLAPVDNNVLNTMKGGATAPIKWQIVAARDASGVPTAYISALSAVTSASGVKNSCDAGAPTDTLEEYATGGTQLRYDTSSNQYIYNWQSPKKPGECWSVIIKLADGQTKVAKFQLK